MSATQISLSRITDDRVFFLVYRDAMGRYMEMDVLELGSGGSPLSRPELVRDMTLTDYQIAVFEYLDGFEGDDGAWNEPVVLMCILSTRLPSDTPSAATTYTAEQVIQVFGGMFDYLVSKLPQMYVPATENPTLDLNTATTSNHDYAALLDGHLSHVSHVEKVVLPEESK